MLWGILAVLREAVLRVTLVGTVLAGSRGRSLPLPAPAEEGGGGFRT